METDVDSKIFVRNHLTDFERLLFAQREIKDLTTENKALRIEIGQLKSYIQELETVIPIPKNHPSHKAVLKQLSISQKRIKQLLADNKVLINKLIAK